MKNGVIGDVGTPSVEELALINKFTRRNFEADEVYAFSVVLCDNDVDRDFERFTDSSLEKMAELFVGKTGIFDHSHKSENQCARIFKCAVEKVDGKLNRLGEQYKRLFARAYMPKSEKLKELILEIDAGIKKEVSVGCTVAKSVCSVCGELAGTCSHRKGRHYRFGGKKQVCFYELMEPIDAYEWSFVAVPAQPLAGVVKNFKGATDGKFTPIGDILKALNTGEVTLSAGEAALLSQKYLELESIAADTFEIISRKKADIVKMFMPHSTEKAAEMFYKVLDRLEPIELYGLYNEGKKLNDTAKPQLALAKKEVKAKTNSQFIVR